MTKNFPSMTILDPVPDAARRSPRRLASCSPTRRSVEDKWHCSFNTAEYYGRFMAAARGPESGAMAEFHDFPRPAGPAIGQAEQMMAQPR